MIQFTSGDMFATPAQVRVNTVNCKGVMGAGVALAFKKRYPEMFKDYQKACEAGAVRPGTLHVWRNLTGEWVINFPTKRHWRNPSRYEDILAGLDALRSYLKEQGPISVALPALGCGHGGLDWNRVSAMIKEKLEDLDAHIFVFEPADSRAAGITAQNNPEQLRELDSLGFRVENLPQRRLEAKSIPHTGLVKGDAATLSKGWIALLPSKNPTEREEAALATIARQMALAAEPVAIALSYATRATEQVAELFLKHGIAVVLILPFGPLARKTIARISTEGRSAPFTMVSITTPDGPWSRTEFANAMNLLRAGASSVLISDPTLEWLHGRAVHTWAEKPVFYIRYEGLSDMARQEFVRMGARPIGRRPDTGEPNLAPLLGAIYSIGDAEPVASAILNATNEDERLAQLMSLDQKLLTGGAILSEWSSFIVREFDAAYTNGTYLAAILTAVSGIETILKSERHPETRLRVSLGDLIDEAIVDTSLKDELHTLRQYRNKWVHVDDSWNDSAILENPEVTGHMLEEMAFLAASALRRTFYTLNLAR